MTHPNYPPHQPPHVPYQPQHTPYPPPSKPNAGLTFLGFSGGMLALVIAGVIVLPILVVIVCCAGAGIIGATTPDPTPTGRAAVITLEPTP